MNFFPFFFFNVIKIKIQNRYITNRKKESVIELYYIYQRNKKYACYR